MKRNRILLLFIISCVSLGAQDLKPGARDYYSRGTEAFLSGDYYGAIEQYKSALETNPNYVDPIVGLAQSYFYLGEYSEALKFARRAQPLDRSNSELLTLEGRILVGAGDFELAGLRFNQVLRTEPNNLGAWFGLAELDLAYGKNLQATDRYRKALQVSPDNRRALLSLILVLDEMGRSEEAAVFVEDVLSYYPRNSQVRYIVAKHYFDTGNLRTAEFHALRALELDATDTDSALLLADIYMHGEAYTEAIRILEELLGSDRRQATVWYALGTALRRTGRIEDAMNAYAYALRYRPDDEIARISLEQLIIDNLDFTDSRRARYAAYHIEIGKEQEARNYLDRALRSYRRALLLDPHSREGRLLYAEVFRIQGYLRKYLNELQVLIDLGYDDSDLRDKVEIQESLATGSVADSWEVDQYLLQRTEFSFDIHTQDSVFDHTYADEDLARYFKSLLLHREHIAVPGDPGINSTFSAAYSRARAGESDYFVILGFEEAERYFSVTAAMYSSRTGGLLKEISAVRTGNQRIADALELIVSEMTGVLPLSGRIIDRKFDTALIDIGLRDGVAVDDEFNLVKPGAIDLASDRVGYDYDTENILGTLRITDLDELIAEGTIQQGQFFDLVNIGDIVVKPAEESAEETTVPVRSARLYQSVIRIR